MRHAYKSKYNTEPGNQVILLMITQCQKWYYLAVKSLSALLRGIASKLLQKISLKSIIISVKIMIIVKIKTKNIKIQPWRKVHESSIYYLC